VAAALEERMAIPVGAVPRPRTARALQRAVTDRVRRESPGTGCLLRALALLGEVRSLGYPARLVLGVRRGEERLDAHAWLEVDGRPFLEGPAVAAQYADLR
jgi:hypothetical protein